MGSLGAKVDSSSGEDGEAEDHGGHRIVGGGSARDVGKGRSTYVRVFSHQRATICTLVEFGRELYQREHE